MSKILDLQNRDGYPAGSLFRKIDHRRVEIVYRHTETPEIGQSVRLWTTVDPMDTQFFKIEKILDTRPAKNDPEARVFIIECRAFNPLDSK